jgi:tartrate-resistant acid phosphatase type 5
MPDFFSEPYLHLAGLTHESALIAWGAFYFRIRKNDGEMKLVDDDSLDKVYPPRRQSVGATSEPYGDHAVVRVWDKAGTVVSEVADHANHCWVTGLKPDTEYTYEVIVNGEQWARGERRDWVTGGPKALVPLGRHYDNRFRTFPDPTLSAPELTFAIIGDFGTGIKNPSTPNRRQHEIARALEKAVDQENVRLILTTGDNIYAKRTLGVFTTNSGEEDDDWFFTFYQPYRYVINRIPVYPSLGNHDSGETEERDDREQVYDNLYIRERIAAEEATERASIGPGLFYRLRYGAGIEFCCIDTSRETFFHKRLFLHERHERFLQLAFPAGNHGPTWRIPFCHHPPFCAGPLHGNTTDMAPLLTLFESSGVRAVFSGHEHNFQHSHDRGIDYFVTGAAGKRRGRPPANFENAQTVSWSTDCHFLLVKISGNAMTVTPIGELDPDGNLTTITRYLPDGTSMVGPITFTIGPP